MEIFFLQQNRNLFKYAVLLSGMSAFKNESIPGFTEGIAVKIHAGIYQLQFFAFCRHFDQTIPVTPRTALSEGETIALDNAVVAVQNPQVEIE